MANQSDREAALVVACREWAADTGQTGMFIEFIGGFNAAWAAGRAELECPESQGDGTPCIIRHIDGPDDVLLNHTSAAVLLSDYQDLDKFKVRVTELEETLRAIECEAELWLHDELSANRAVPRMASIAARALLTETSKGEALDKPITTGAE